MKQLDLWVFIINVLYNHSFSLHALPLNCNFFKIYIYFIAEDIHLIAYIQYNIEKTRYVAWCWILQKRTQVSQKTWYNLFFVCKRCHYAVIIWKGVSKTYTSLILIINIYVKALCPLHNLFLVFHDFCKFGNLQGI